MIKSIFDLEKRTDLKKECLRLEKYLNTEQFCILKSLKPYYTFWDMVDSFIEFWPYRYTATNIEDYFNFYELPFEAAIMNNEQCFYYLQIVLDIIMWLNDQKENYNLDSTHFELSVLEENNKDRFYTITNNISLIAELSNYDIEKINEHYTFVKKDADVDSILHQLETEEDLRLVILSYNDFRIEKNIDEKAKRLKKIADWLEPKRKDFEKYNKPLTSDIFYILNNANIRHNNNKQLNLSTEETLSLYNDLFTMMIHLIRSENIKNIQTKINQLKNK